MISINSLRGMQKVVANPEYYNLLYLNEVITFPRSNL